MRAKSTQSMDMIDSFLSEKVNSDSIKRIMDNVVPALNITFQKIIEEEARKILYSLNYQENVSSALAQLYGLKSNPEHYKAKLFIDSMSETFKDDPEIRELLKQRPVNLMMMKGLDSEEIQGKIFKKLDSLTMEHPIEALHTF